MKRERKAQVATLAVLAGVLIFAIARNSGWRRGAPEPEATPQDTVYAVFEAAREGNVQRYLDGYAGQMAADLRQAVAEKGEDGFAAYLKGLNVPIRGIAITEPQAVSDREVKARVEFVYQDRNEVQVMYLERLDGKWKITRLEAAQRVKTLIPYGTPVQ
jgi:hypothetical protein